MYQRIVLHNGETLFGETVSLGASFLGNSADVADRSALHTRFALIQNVGGKYADTRGGEWIPGRTFSNINFIRFRILFRVQRGAAFRHARLLSRT